MMVTEKFEILTDAQHMRTRPAMYIGSVSTEEVSGMFFGKYQTLNVIPGLLKIISEIIDNSIDEAIRTNFKYANKIHISFKREESLDGSYWQVIVEDNGRGIPVQLIGKQYRPVIAWTQARAGSNFSDDRETIGANGVGSFATCVFSSEFIGETSDGTNYLKFVSNGLGKIKSVNVKPSSKHFTKVSFIPDLTAFSILEISDDHIDFIKDRVENLAAVYPDITFEYNDVKIKVKNSKEYAAKYCEKFVIADDGNNTLIFGAAGLDEEFRLHSYVNGLWIQQGGTHVNYVLDKITNTLKEHIKKKYKIEVMPSTVKQHLMFVSILRGFINMKFDSQTKTRITNTYGEISTHLKEIDFDKISRQILNTPEILDPMIEAILYKKEMAEKLALAKKQKSVAKLRVVNHIAATDSNIENRTLHICEGASALGSLISVRDSKRHGGYPLKGKVLNARGMKPVDILKNKEVAELLSVIGLEFGKPAKNLNYGKIAIMTDQDIDGASIFCLLLNLFSYWPDLFTSGRIYRLITPLYSCTKGKDIKIFYDKESYDKFVSKGYEVSYNKGLGTLSKEVYRQAIMNPYLIKVEVPNDFAKLEMAFGESADNRKEWMLA
jgi:DNA gyrase/topoisomerase IV subunit B